MIRNSGTPRLTPLQKKTLKAMRVELALYYHWSQLDPATTRHVYAMLR